MKTSELIELLSCVDEEEVFIEIDDLLYDIQIGHVEETFDGFDTVYEACIKIQAKK